MILPAVCPYRPPCPGCPRYGRDALDPGALGRLRALGERAGIEMETVVGPGAGFRHRARLSVRGPVDRPGIGIFEEGSHRLVAIEGCPLHHPSITALLEALPRALSRHRIPPYDEAAHRGVLRALQIAVERSSGRLQVVFVVRDRLGPGSHAARLLAPVIAELEQLRAPPRGAPSPRAPQPPSERSEAPGDARSEAPGSARSEAPLLHSVWLNAQPERTNTLLGERFEHVSGPGAIRDESGGARVFYPPGAFGQANPELHDEAVRRIHARVPTGVRVVEFHAGVGTIGLGLAGRNPLVFNEIGPGSLEGLELGLAELPETLERPAVFAGPADAHRSLVDRADVVLVDPPRKGLSPGLLERLEQGGPQRLLYLSCGLDSFLRDTERLVARGWELRELTALGYFPFTEHVETLAWFER